MLQASSPQPPLPIPVEDFARLFDLGELNDPQRALFEATTGGLATIGLADCFRLMRRLAHVAGQETLSLSARPMMTGSAGFVLSSAAGAATLGDALRQIASGYNLLHGADYNRVEHRAGQLIYALHDDDFPYTRPRDDYLHFVLECTLVYVHAAVCEMAQVDLSLRLQRITTRRPSRTGPGSPGLDFWPSPITFGAKVYAIAYDGALERLPMLGLRAGQAPDLAVHNRILSLIEQPWRGEADPDRRLATCVRRALEVGGADQESVARQLGMSVATLRRRLADEDTSFRGERQRALNAYACERLLETRDIGTVAEELGFSDPRAFTRAFKAWNGVTPSDYRARHLLKA